MDTKLFVTFVLLNMANVIIQTIKSLCTIKGGKIVAATANAVAFGLYTVVIVYMVADLPLWLKVIVVSACNFVGVYIVKWLEEKSRKDKLWKIEFTVRSNYAPSLSKALDDLNIPYNYIPNIGKHTIFNIYCKTQKESILVKELSGRCKAKYFVSETKYL